MELNHEPPQQATVLTSPPPLPCSQQPWSRSIGNYITITHFNDSIRFYCSNIDQSKDFIFFPLYSDASLKHFQQKSFLSGPVSAEIETYSPRLWIFVQQTPHFTPNADYLCQPEKGCNASSWFVHSLIANMARKRRGDCIPPPWNRQGESHVFLPAHIRTVTSLLSVPLFFFEVALLKSAGASFFVGQSH